MILKLTIKELEEVLEQAKRNDKRGDASCVLLFHDNGYILQPSAYQECNDHVITIRATVCSI